MRILLTNDDGISAPGLAALYHAVHDMGEVHVVAPAEVQSAQSHAVTFHKKIATRTHRVMRSDGAGHLFEGIAVEGKPADCVKLAVAHLVPSPIDLVISGINAGANIGINVIYSGTVAAAMEAGFMGVPAIAVSLHLGDSTRTRWDLASRHARAVISRLLEGPFEPHTVLNVNIPILDDGAEPLGLRVVPISTSPIIDSYSPTDEAGGDRSYNHDGGMGFHHTPPDSDVDAIFRRHITLTPLHFDLTHKGRLATWGRYLQYAEKQV
ncbi:MAG: 5'/3'-nucleotidase SurE [Planctomycetes bacterium]|nr:5'/3'-nucleotidase SurE [Planctomycetota bacterium]